MNRKDAFSDARMKSPVALRRKPIKGGAQSLYLDIYWNGHRTYEFLKLYLLDAKTPEEKELNRQTLATAQAIRAQRQVDLQNGVYGFGDGFNLDADFLDFYRDICRKRFENEESLGNWGNWYSSLKHLEKYCNGRRPTLRDITPAWVEGYKVYLDKVAHRRNTIGPDGMASSESRLSNNSKISYFAKLRAALNEAVKRHMMPSSPAAGIENFKELDAEKAYLTIDELRRLAATPCAYPTLRNAFIFSCLTGMRKSDIMRLLWGSVTEENGYTRIIFRQKKTKGMEYLDISPEAVKYMGARGPEDQHVFRDFHYSSKTNSDLRYWAVSAGITKHVTFHSGRHTFAVMMLTLGADIYTLQKLLGHKELRTTQIYADILDDKKREAVSRIPGLPTPKNAEHLPTSGATHN